MGKVPEYPVVTYTITFTVPEGHVYRLPDELLKDAVDRAVQGMILRLTDGYPYDYKIDPSHPYTVTVKVDKEDDPAGKSHTDEMTEALSVVSRMLGHRCGTDDGGLEIELHSDKDAMELLAAHDWGTVTDRNGQITGYLY
jgi:hypothetical protein